MRLDLDESFSVTTEAHLAHYGAVGLASIRVPDAVIEIANPAFISLLDESELAAIQGRSLRSWFSDIPASALQFSEQRLRAPENIPFFCLRRLRTNGNIQIVDVAVCPVMSSDGIQRAILTMVVHSDDVTVKQPWYRQEHRDALTGLYNRRALDARLDGDVAAGRDVILCILDLDDFGTLNERYGHEVGDAMLQELARRLRLAVPNKALIARLGGDEFAILLNDPISVAALDAFLWNIESMIGEAIIFDDAAWSFTVSCGICHHRTGSGHGAESILRRADQALYLSKMHKHDRSRFWMVFGDDAPIRPTLCQILLGQGAVDVHYQPILDTRSGRIVAIEALARMREPGGKEYSPEHFLSQMNTTDSAELSRVVLTRALSDLARLDREGYHLDISFNLSPQSMDHECLDSLRKVVQGSGIDPHRITVEVLESSDFADTAQAAEILNQIQGLGLEIALDDMGSAYASLLRLKNLPVNKIKLDQGFVCSLERSPADLHIVRAIQDLALDLRLGLIAEGVESEAVLDALMTMGIPNVQGFALARPLPLTHLEAFLKNFNLSKEPLPRTLFGFYAGTMVSHAAICKMLIINPAELDQQRLPLATCCRGHAVLDRLGHPGESLLGTLHQRYHEALGEASRLGLGAYGSPCWEHMQNIFNEFMLAVLSAWRLQTGEES